MVQMDLRRCLTGNSQDLLGLFWTSHLNTLSYTLVLVEHSRSVSDIACLSFLEVEISSHVKVPLSLVQVLLGLLVVAASNLLEVVQDLLLALPLNTKTYTISSL